MNVKNDLETVWSYKSVQIVFNVHNPVKLKIFRGGSRNSRGGVIFRLFGVYS